MSELIVSVSGLRGIVGDTLTPEVAVRYGLAFSSTLPDGPLVITHDGRTSGRMLVDAVSAGLAAAGRDLIDADVAATPTTGVLVRHTGAVGGIQVSASHNPPEYNGLKLMGADGRVISASEGEQVKDRWRDMPPARVVGKQTGKIDRCQDTTTAHQEMIAEIVDVPRIRARGFRVLLDANHGSGSLLGRRLLKGLGCQVDMLGGQPDGRFEHPPEPTAANLADVCGQVTARRADVGFCQDPDADRLAVMDEQGRYLGEEYTLALCVDHVLRQRKGPVVTNCSTSRMSQDIAVRHGVPFFSAAVGEANVTDVMIRQQAVIGGEGNGGVIDPRVGYVRDSFVGMALLLDAMAEREMSVGQLADALPHYSMLKTKIPLQRDRLAAAYDALQKHFADATVDRQDGLRLDWADKWLLIRPSNTEPLARIIAEAATAEEAKRLCDEAARTI
ncbi:MAG: phosphoglucosamine mutase [Planctomycetales bacterium]|nr:phosphoglucosamine mutase [Planctomycetales bacterium]NIM08076.1 phosphoglucosamine mutase [Planctomycetales bacterium]NIN07567.1 phosphoglucosamine mutase [Planctomycetales bacterium]NIN76678.1 phosphoglucosamine mutase [Planctomycetales bacterium]NIO33866.1 phosphoglucosamine mutase [Planctomycetales bacterium]